MPDNPKEYNIYSKILVDALRKLFKAHFSEINSHYAHSAKVTYEAKTFS